MIKRLSRIVVSVFLAASAACGAANGEGTSTNGGPVTAPTGSEPDAKPIPKEDSTIEASPTPEAKPTPEAEPTRPSSDICLGTGSHDFHFEGVALSTWEGHHIAVVAAEFKKTVVRVSGAIKGGSVDLACAESLADNKGYGRVAAYVDVNGDGEC